MLTEMLCIILGSHPDLFYYQGFHEICAVIMLNVDLDFTLTLALVARLATCHIRDNMMQSLENCMAHCDLLFPLLERTRPTLHEFIIRYVDAAPIELLQSYVSTAALCWLPSMLLEKLSFNAAAAGNSIIAAAGKSIIAAARKSTVAAARKSYCCWFPTL
jgi:hypothetical protein